MVLPQRLEPRPTKEVVVGVLETGMGQKRIINSNDGLRYSPDSTF